jgi:ribosomal-protein-alanine N-acetyltransferase
MTSSLFRAATSREVQRLTRALLAAKTFADEREIDAVHRSNPWQIQVSERGDVAVLGRWREHLSVLSIEALWCPTTVIPAAAEHFLDLARAHGMIDVVSPPTLVEETGPYRSAGMRTHATVATLTLAPLTGAAVIEMSDGLVWRPAGADDIGTLLRVDARCFEPFWRYDETHMARFSRIGRLALAEISGEAVGYTLCTIDDGESLLGRLCVSPEWRRRGIGSTLLSAAVQQVREQGGTRVTLSTQTGNAASQALYRRAGFRDTGRRYAFLRFGTDEG